MKCIDFNFLGKSPFTQVIFMLETLHYCVDQGHEKCHYWFYLVTFDLEHEERLVFHGMTLL